MKELTAEHAKAHGKEKVLIKFFLCVLCALWLVFSSPASAACSCRKNPVSEVAVFAGTPEEMGRRHGELFAKDIRLLVRKYLHRGLYKLGGFPREEAERRARHYEKFLSPEYVREMEALAEAAGVSYLDILTLNVIYEVVEGPRLPQAQAAAEPLPQNLALAACSTFAVAREEGGVLMGRNLDWINLNLAHRHGRVFVFRPEGKRAFASLAWPGIIGVTSGMSERGLAAALNTSARVPYREPNSPAAMFELRRALEEADSLERMQAMLSEKPRATAQVLTLADSRRALALERAGTKAAAVPMREGWVASSNFFRLLDGGGYGAERFEAMKRRCENGGIHDMTQAKAALRETAIREGRWRLVTVHSVVFEPAALRMHVAAGRIPAPRGKYFPLELAPYFAGAAP